MKLIDTTNIDEYRKAGGDSQSAENQRILSTLIRNNVRHCVSCLVSDLLKIVHEVPHSVLKETSFDADELMDLCRCPGDPEEFASQENWYKFSDLDQADQDRIMVALKTQARQEGEDPDDVEEPEFVQCPHGLAKLTDLDVCGADDWSELCDEQRIEVEDNEVYEHWIVDPWFAARLKECGETVGEICGLTIYGRTCTGQSMSLDYVTQRIGASMQILVGQKNDWSRTA